MSESFEKALQSAEESFFYARARLTELAQRLLRETDESYAYKLSREFVDTVPFYRGVLKTLVDLRTIEPTKFRFEIGWKMGAEGVVHDVLPLEIPDDEERTEAFRASRCEKRLQGDRIVYRFTEASGLGEISVSLPMGAEIA
jgi:hypothetical protein